MLHGTGCHGNTEALLDLVAERYVKEIFLEEVPSKLRSKEQVRIRQSRKNFTGKVSRM